jgi:serine/threonine-protein kinase RsbW
MPSGQTHGEVISARLELANRREDLDRAQRRLIEAVEHQRYDRSSCFAIRLAVEEALSNALRHGNRNDPSKKVRLEYRVGPHSVVIDIRDEGGGFNPGDVPDPTRDENLELPSGRGLVLMRAYMTSVNFIPPGNHVHMEYQRPRSADSTGGARPT